MPVLAPLAVAIALFAPATPPAAPVDPVAAATEAQVRALDARVVAALDRGDAVTLTALADADFALTTSRGAWLGRSGLADWARAAEAAAPARAAHTDLGRDVDVQLFEGVAVVSGLRWSADGAGRVHRVRYTDVYRRAGTGWRLASAQDTPLGAAVDARLDRGVAMAPPPAGLPADPDGDDATLRALNAEYVDAFRRADAEWYAGRLAPGYRVVFGDGSRHDRAAALADFAQPHFEQHIADFPVDRVQLQRVGELVLVRAENAYTLKDGRRGINRYTDVWQRLGGRWWCLAAHITVHRPPA